MNSNLQEENEKENSTSEKIQNYLQEENEKTTAYQIKEMFISSLAFCTLASLISSSPISIRIIHTSKYPIIYRS